jgi:hypothetical protein
MTEKARSDISPFNTCIRCVWIVIQLIVVYCLTNHVSPFFYQRF